MRRHFRLERKGAVERAPKINPETTPHGDLRRRPKEMAARANLQPETPARRKGSSEAVPSPGQFQTIMMKCRKRNWNLSYSGSHHQTSFHRGPRHCRQSLC